MQDTMFFVSNIPKLLAAEEGAKRLYDIWAHRTSNDLTAFERLSTDHQEAWREIFQATVGEPECSSCGEALACPDCDYDEFRYGR